ncbi:ATP:Cob(I)alamin adenosyltransferase [hydrothermal vent metagenome]|uniref:ATP:Cob(I)alamin adenosyltransferase n=1 Tax=hydrothermal vent metagenome TaxID=652676 RepID=A0A3B1DD45_9ZZZZ
MVHLNKIYTKGGDHGETSLGSGERVAKNHPRIIAYGGVDELNSLIGIVLTTELSDSIKKQLAQVQNDLFDLGADLCVPETEENPEHPPLRVTAKQVERLEEWIDTINENLQALQSFILPGGSIASAYLHLGRTVCRRVEANLIALMQIETINEQVLMYLNRLSDYLFVLARKTNNNGTDDVLWVPGGE